MLRNCYYDPKNILGPEAQPKVKEYSMLWGGVGRGEEIRLILVYSNAGPTQAYRKIYNCPKFGQAPVGSIEK